ncbi:MAG: MFS transporter, partial [Hyphomonadaceae bacterium]|nr:MFS transporter [Hyphomonadaceae bacterium]
RESWMETATGETAAKPPTPLRTVVVASSAGTAFEWYDFFVYGALTTIFSRKFFNAAEIGEANATLATLAVFAAGLLFRPLGALIFGRMGDRFGRKGAFLATVIMMGGATFLIGLLPDNKELVGVSAVLLVLLRILQGMAVGGEYGGAAIYVAEHCAPHHRGQSTSWIQASAAFGLVGALIVVLGTRTAIGEEAFFVWGWRIPFLASAILVGISIWMRLRLNESPEFEKMKAEGTISRAPYAEVFLKWGNMKLVLVSILSFLMAQGAIWWCAFSYTQIFLERFMKLPGVWANLFLMGATLLSIPLYVFFGWLSDRIGRKPVLILGMVLSVVAVFPAFKAFSAGSNPALLEAQQNAPVEIHADPASCTFQFDLLGGKKYETACDISRAYLTNAGIGFSIKPADAGTSATVHVGGAIHPVPEGAGLIGDRLTQRTDEINGIIKAALAAANYPPPIPAPSNAEQFQAQAADFDWPQIFVGFTILVIGATALYGPMAAALVELFPTRVRYTALSVPYHIGVGWVGGFMPMTAFAIATATGDVFAGLWYPIVFGVIGIVSCLFLFPETKGRALT